MASAAFAVQQWRLDILPNDEVTEMKFTNSNLFQKTN